MSNFNFPLRQLPNFTEFLVLEKAFGEQELQMINQLWAEEKKEDAQLEGNKSVDDGLRKSSVIPIYPEMKTNWIFEKMMNIIFQANQYYFFDLNGFFEPLQLAEYGEGDFFDWHLDFGTGPTSNRKLSLTVQLSDSNEYEGGDLEFQINQNSVKAPRTQGTVVVFPSFIMHRVTEITKGKRRSIVGWVSGPPYR